MGLFSKMMKSSPAEKQARKLAQEGIGFKAPSSQNSVLSHLASMLQPKWAEAPQRDTVDWLKLFNDSPRLGPIHKIAEDVASADWAIYKKLPGGEKEKIEEHPLIDLFNKPNPLPETSWFSLLYGTEAYLEIAGEAFWVLERSGLGQVGEIWSLPPHWVVNTPNQGEPNFEVQTPDGARLSIPPEDVIYFKEQNLINPYGRGRGRAKAIGDEVEADEYMARWSKNFFYNNATPPVVIEAPGAGKSDVDRLQEMWMQKYSGIKNAHKPAVLPFAGKVHQMMQNQREMDFVESRKYIRDQANQHFRMPPELMGIIENSNRATIEAADYIYRSSVLVNRITMIQRTIQHQLVERFHESEGICFEFENVIPEDKEFELKVANEGFKLGAITIDEWRQKNGYDALEGNQGNVFLIPSGVIAVRNPLDSAQLAAAQAMPQQPTTGPKKPAPPGTNPDKPDPPEPPTTPQPEEEEEEESPVQGRSFKPVSKDFRTNGYTKADEESIADQFDEALSELEKAHIKKVEKFLVAQGKRFATHISKQSFKELLIISTKADGDEPSPDDILNAESQADEALDTFDWVDETGKLHEEMTDELVKAAEEGTNLANGLFQLGVSFDLIRDVMLDHIKTEGLDKVVGITNTTKLMLRKALIEGLLQGEGSASLAKRIRETAQEYAYRRSFVIARTESHNTMVKGTIETYKEAGATKKKWLTVRDGRERPSHKKLHGKIVGIEEQFSNKCYHPGDSKGPAEEVIQCRCALAPVFD